MQLLLDPWFVITGCVAVTLLGLSKGGFFGLGTVALPLLALFVPPLQAAAILLPTLLAQDVLTIWSYRRAFSGENLLVMIPGMAIGVTLAYLFAAAISPAGIRAAIGVIILLFLLRQALAAYLERAAPRPSRASGFLFGMIGGFTTMLANAGGPAWQMHLLPQRLEKLTYVGTVTILFAASNVMKIPAYAGLGQLTRDNLLAGAALVPLAMAANYAGIRLVQRTPADLFYRIAYALMFCIALALIHSALTDLSAAT